MEICTVKSKKAKPFLITIFYMRRRHHTFQFSVFSFHIVKVCISEFFTTFAVPSRHLWGRSYRLRLSGAEVKYLIIKHL